VIITIGALLILSYICRRIGSSWLFPPSMYALYWGIVLVASTIITIGTNRLTAEATQVFLVGAYCFALGGIIALGVVGSSRKSSIEISNKRKRIVRIIIVAFALGVVVLVPFFINAIRQIANSLRIDSFAMGSRFVLGLPDRGGISRVFRAFTSVAGVLAYYAAWQYSGSRRDRITLGIAIIAPLAMHTITFARTPIFTLIVGVLAILTLRGRIRRTKIVIVLLLALILSLGMGAALNKGPEFGSGDSPIMAIVRNLATYYVGGPIGFGQVMDVGELVGQKGISLRFFTQALNSLGAKIDIPSNVLGYAGGDIGNVYTIYFAYWLDWGWLGIIIFSILAGLVSSTVYLLARRGNCIAGAAFGLVMSSLLDSAAVDILFGSAIPWLLIGMVGWILFYVQLPHSERRVQTKRPLRTKASHL
jgi:oligosaccharide repeat unit polymerase